MLNFRRVAVTGGLACGKSTVCHILKSLGANVVYADEIVHQLLSPKTKIGQEIIKLLGSEIVSNGQINRSTIAKMVFNHPQLLKELENIVHPAVLTEIESQAQKNRSPLFVVEVPLLFEAGWESFFDTVIAVLSAPELSLKRFLQNPLNTIEGYNQRLANQLSPEEKAKKADIVLVNNGSIEELTQSVKNIYFQFLNPKGSLS